MQQLAILGCVRMADMASLCGDVHHEMFDADMYVQDAVKQKLKEDHDKAAADNIVDKLVVWSGSSIGLVTSIQHAEDVVNKMLTDVKLIFLNNAQLATKPRVLGQGS